MSTNHRKSGRVFFLFFMVLLIVIQIILSSSDPNFPLEEALKGWFILDSIALILWILVEIKWSREKKYQEITKFDKTQIQKNIDYPFSFPNSQLQYKPFLLPEKKEVVVHKYENRKIGFLEIIAIIAAICSIISFIISILKIV